MSSILAVTFPETYRLRSLLELLERAETIMIVLACSNTVYIQHGTAVVSEQEKRLFLLSASDGDKHRHHDNNAASCPSGGRLDHVGPALGSTHRRHIQRCRWSFLDGR